MINRTLGRLLILIVGVFGLTVLLSGIITPKTGAALSGSDFQAGRIIDDQIFFDSTSLGYDAIKAFLNAKVPVCDTNGELIYSGTTTRAQYGTSRGNPPPYICLKDYRQDMPATPADAYCPGAIGAGSNNDSAQIIYEISRACGISPKVLIVLLQKEQSLVTDDWPWPIQYRSATGYGCPDTAACDSLYYGFFNQVYNAAHQYQRYAKQPQLFNYRPSTTSFVAYNPSASCGGTNIAIQNQATANLYNYTPYQPNQAALNNLYGTGDSCSAYGNRNFWRLFNDWFGSTRSGFCITSQTTIQTSVAFHGYNPGGDSADFLIASGAGSGCVESHIWNPGFTSWQAHIASNSSSIDTANSQIVFGDLDGKGRDYPLLFGLQNTSSGKIESHVWDHDMQSWLAHTASSQPSVNPTDCKIIVADLAGWQGTGRDEVLLACLRNTASGKIELHQWNAGLQTWAWHTATNMPAIDPTQASVVAGDINGDRRDELILVAYNHTGSSKVEFHIWDPGQQSWQTHITSNAPEMDPTIGSVEFAGLNNGVGSDVAVLELHKNTGSGKIEFHLWNTGFGSWRDHITTNQQTIQ